MGDWEKKRDVIRRYDATARIYDLRYEQEQTAKYNAALRSLEKRDLRLVLDVGCGTGLLFDHIKNKAEATIGLDISKKTLLKARERAATLPNIHIICADADFMPLKEHTFDHVFAVTLIQNSPNPAQTLNEINQVSKDDAAIVVTGLKKIFSKEAFEHLLCNAGLHIIVLNDEESLKCYVAICSKIQH
jgi:malonyl-CoA O-methyltransferase